MALYSPDLIKKLEENLKKDVQSQSFCSLAYIYYKQGDVHKAEKICQQGLEHHPSYSPAYILLAEIKYKEDKLDKAIDLLNKAKELAPNNPSIYKLLAQIHKKRNESEKTLEAYRMVVFLSPNDSTALSSFHHLDKILNTFSSDDKKDKILENKKKLSLREEQKLEKLNKILVRVESYIQKPAGA